MDWRSFYLEMDPNKAWDILYNHVISVLDKYHPGVTFTNVLVRAEWITPDLFEMIQQRDKPFEKAYTSKDNTNWKEACKLRKKKNHLCSLAKNEFTKRISMITPQTPSSSGKK